VGRRLWENTMICPKCNETLFLDATKGNGNPINYWKCPKCKSHNRGRLLYLLLKDRHNGKVLEISPISILQGLFSDHTTIDFPPRHSEHTDVVMAQRNEDLRALSFSDESFDTIICSHVLDAIKEEEIAIKELFRVLRKGGSVYILAPIHNIPHTIELETPEMNHWRICGKDYFDRFDGEVIIGDDEQYGLSGEHLIICKNIKS